jgi:hypothetical protein
MKAWADCCRASTRPEFKNCCSWFTRESLDPSLLDQLWISEGHRRSPEEIDKSVWKYLGFSDPFEGLNNTDETSASPVVRNEDVESNEAYHFEQELAPDPLEAQNKGTDGSQTPDSGIAVNGDHVEQTEHSSEAHATASVESTAPPLLARPLESQIFYISPFKLVQMKKDAGVGFEVDGVPITTNDAILAHFWRALIRARMLVAQEAGRVVREDELSSLESPVDARQFFSDKLPPSYVGNAVMIARASMSLLRLTAPYSETPLKDIATIVRKASACIGTQLVHDAYTLLKTVPDYTDLNYSFMTALSLDVCISAVMLLPVRDISFGDEFFEDEGRADSWRPMMDGFNSGGFRLCYILPITKAGGVKLHAGLFPEELEKILEDEDFTKYATYICS